MTFQTSDQSSVGLDQASRSFLMKPIRSPRMTGIIITYREMRIGFFQSSVIVNRSLIC
jgi:hypothetical protein